MRVLLVTNDYPPKPGGIQQYLGNIVGRVMGDARFGTDGADHTILVLGPDDPDAVAEPHVVRSDRRWMMPTPEVRRWIVEHATDFDADVVVFGAPHPLAQLGSSVRTATGLPYVVMTHGAEVTVPAAVPGLRHVLARTLRMADGLFAVSAFTARRVGALAGRNVVVLGAGVDLDRFRPPAVTPRDPIVLGCVSRFVPRKGHERVIEAAEVLAARGHTIEVLIAGRGRLERQLRRRAQAAAVPVRLEVDVAWDSLADLYREMTVFAMPVRSRWAGLEVEGLGIVYLEALASGVPVLAGTSGGAPETVTPAGTGFVATDVEHIAEGVEIIVGDLDRFRSVARAAAEAHWSWDAVVERWWAELHRVVNNNGEAR